MKFLPFFLIFSLFSCSERSTKSSKPETVVTTKYDVGDTLVYDSLGNDLWIIIKLGEDSNLVSIQWIEDSITLYNEKFSVHNDCLFHAYEGLIYHFEDSLYRIEWNCDYTIEGGKIVHHISMGHGETETDDWEPNSIFDQWEARKSDYKRLISSTF